MMMGRRILVLGATGSTGKQYQIILESLHNTPKPKLPINRKSVAKYLGDSQKDVNLVRNKVVISNV